MLSTVFRRRVIAVALFFLVFAVAALKFGTSSEAFSTPAVQDADIIANKVAPVVLNDTANGDTASVVIFLADQADVSAANDMADQDARGWYVYNTLTEHAARTQASIKAALDAEGRHYQSYWAANMLIADADRGAVERLAMRPDVARIDSNRAARWIEDPSLADLQDSSDVTEVPETVTTGVANVNAPQVWALGFTGQGIIIANQDTGMRWTHNALKPHYRGWDGTTADHNYNWHDSIHSGGGSCGANAVAPCDDNGHGTHTTGTTSGDDGAGNQVGVAPGAKWIGCRNMDQGNGTPATYTECFQFFIAPTDLSGANPDPTRRPHVMNNSWGCPIVEGCTTSGELEAIVNNTLASGIFVVVSNGNDGSACSSVSNGAQAGPPAIYEGSFSVGAINASTNTIASFSSRGPSLFYTPNLLKPNVSAPGVNVNSSTRTSDSSYSSSFSGTSMAGPHVVGTVALLWSARPQLSRNIAATKTILQNSANPSVTVSPVQTCGGTPSTQIPNNTFGYGRIDALAAVNAAGGATPSPTPTPVTPTPTPITPTPTPITPTPTPITPTPSPTPTPSSLHSRADFDADGKTDLSVFRPSEGNWYLLRSTAGFVGQNWGLSTDKIVPGDYDADGKTDLAVFRPSSGTWYVLKSATGTVTGAQWGTAGDVPLSGDFDGDKRTDLTIFRPSDNTWYIVRSTAGFIQAQFGAAGDVPLVMDSKGNGISNVGVFRPGSNTWFIGNSLTNPAQDFTPMQWGQAGDLLVPADYDGDSKDDVAVFRPSNGEWYIHQSSNGALLSIQFGASGDVPVPGDYDGDGKDDEAVYRSGTWYLNRSTAGFSAAGFGLGSDLPVPKGYIP